MAFGRASGHIGGMNNDATYPYSLAVLPCNAPAGHYRWTIRKYGKLLQRSDRPHLTERLACERGEAELERHLTPSRNGR